ncbi:MAG: hypothetical protein AB8B65_19925 [Kordia sp.]|uniref:hypothetical protein n=1 Tax=Kordia sp. TaxID=1965332 RepID=UPI003858E036
MKKSTIKNLAINKKTISKFNAIEKLKGGRNTSYTSCLCIDTVCECEMDTPFR